MSAVLRAYEVYNEHGVDALAASGFWHDAQKLSIGREARATARYSMAMSQENVEIVRRYLTVSGEQSILSALEPHWHPQVTWYTDPRVPEPGVYRGKEAVSTYLAGFIEAIGAIRATVKEVIDLDGEEVLAVTAVSTLPPGALERRFQLLEWSLIITLREGKVYEVHSFLDKAEALKATWLPSLGKGLVTPPWAKAP